MGRCPTPRFLRHRVTTKNIFKKVVAINHACANLDSSSKQELSLLKTSKQTVQTKPTTIELSRISGRAVGKDETAADYWQQINPGGRLWNFIKLGQLAYTKGKVLATHGGLTRHNIGFVPDLDERIFNSMDRWVVELNRWGHQALNQFENQLKERQGTKPIYSHIVSYGDAVFEPLQQRVISTSRSVIYSHKSREDGNYRLYDQFVVDTLKSSGKAIALQGHSPVGNVSLPISDGNGFIQVMADTSYSEKGAFASLEVVGDQLNGKGLMSNGEPIRYSVSPSVKSPIGLLADDKIVIGQNSTGQYIAYKYDGRTIVETPIDIQKAKMTVAWPTEDFELVKRRQELEKSLREKGLPLLNDNEIKTGFYENRIPIFISGSAKFAFQLQMEPIVQKIAKEFLEALDPKKYYIVTGGSDSGVEQFFHTEAQRLGIHNLALVAWTARPSHVNKANAVHLMGETWEDRMSPALEYVKAKAGHAVFVAGGVIVKQGIKQARDLNMNVHLFTGVDGAAKEMADAKSGFANAQELIAQIGLPTNKADHLVEYPGNLRPVVQSSGRCGDLLSSKK